MGQITDKEPVRTMGTDLELERTLAVPEGLIKSGRVQENVSMGMQTTMQFSKCHRLLLGKR